jgi:hypothetical protein
MSKQYCMACLLIARFSCPWIRDTFVFCSVGLPIVLQDVGFPPATYLSLMLLRSISVGASHHESMHRPSTLFIVLDLSHGEPFVLPH